MSNYDSTKDTLAHIHRVAGYIGLFAVRLKERGRIHDASKLEEPEKSVFDRVTPRLRELKYDTPEYRASLRDMGVALKHHYANNRHHPEHWEGGIHDMDLVDLIEMLCDWKAAGERHPDGSILRSIEINSMRFGYNDELKGLLLNTAASLGWIG